MVNNFGIGADSNLYSGELRKRGRRTLKQFWRAYRKHYPEVPIFDVGSGDSWLRDELRREYYGEIYTTDVDLDDGLLPFADGFFKAITSFEVIEHLMNPLFHIRELLRVCDNGGRLYLTTPNDSSLIYKAEHLLGRKYAPHFHQFSMCDLNLLLEKGGWKVTKAWKFFKSGRGTLARVSRNGLFVEARPKVEGVLNA